jgi:hypothetical protein
VNENINITYQNVNKSAEAMVRRQFIPLNAYIRKEEILKSITNLPLQ